MLRHCFEGSGASWERSGSADSAVAGGGCGTGGGAAQHQHLDPLGKSTEVTRVYYYSRLKVNISQIDNEAFFLYTTQVLILYININMVHRRQWCRLNLHK